MSPLILGSETVNAQTAVAVAIIGSLPAYLGFGWMLLDKWRKRHAELQRTVAIAETRVMVRQIMGELKTNGGLPPDVQNRPHGTTKEEAIIGVVETQKQTAMIAKMLELQQNQTDGITAVVVNQSSFNQRLGTLERIFAALENRFNRYVLHEARGDLSHAELVKELEQREREIAEQKKREEPGDKPQP